MKLQIFIIGLLCFVSAKGQTISIDTSLSAQKLVTSVLLGDESDLIVKNVKYTGSAKSIAAFKCDLETDLIDEGILLSTGNVFDAQGPNDRVDQGSRSSARRDESLQAIATSLTTDAAVLEFDLIALRDSLEFTYVFASEEYPEYVNKGVNDVFGFFIKEVGGRGIFPRNIALLPGSRTPVSIDNVNHRRNEQFFLPSDFWHIHPPEFWKAHPTMGVRARLFQFDGFTIPLKANIRLAEGKTYHFKIAIADVGDRIYDSAVMIKAKSLASKGKRIATADKIIKQYVTEQLNSWNTDKLSLSKDSLRFDLQIQFNTNEAVILQQYQDELMDLVELLEGMKNLKVMIIGHTDDQGTQEANLKLSLDRAKSVQQYLTKAGVSTDRLSVAGKGELAPLLQNKTEEGRWRNRRVEFRLAYN